MEKLTSTERENTRHDWSKEDYAEYRRKLVRECQRRRRERAREEGMCSICAAYPAEYGRKTCQKCFMRAVVWQAKHKGAKNG